MKEYAEIIDSRNLIDIVEGKITSGELKEKILKRYYGFCKDENEKEEALEYIEEAFISITPFLDSITKAEYDAISKYGRKIGTISYEINDALRKKRPLNNEDRNIVNLLDSAMEKFKLSEEIVVYRALKPKDGIDFNFENMVGRKVTDKGYMSTSLSKENSYAYFEEYEVVLEITLPVGSKGIYVEWFKGSNDEKELLLERGTTVSINSARKEVINGREKTVFTCDVLEKEIKRDLDGGDFEK